MTPERAIAIVGLATVFGGGWYAKSIVNNREETKRAEVEAKKLVSPVARRDEARKYHRRKSEGERGAARIPR